MELERMQFAIISSWENDPVEKVVLTFEREEDALRAADSLKGSKSDFLGCANYRVALVRITELVDAADDVNRMSQAEMVPNDTVIAGYNDHDPLV